MKVTVAALLQAIQHCNLSGGDEIVFVSEGGKPVSASIDIDYASQILTVNVSADSELFDYRDFDCDCGESHCYYCGG